MEVQLYSNSSFEKIVAITARKPSKSILSVKCLLFFFFKSNRLFCINVESSDLHFSSYLS